MRTETITIYSFNELPEATRETVRDNFRAMPDLWAWGAEWWDSAQAFCQIAPIDIREADYWRGHVDCRWTGDDNVAELSGIRAWKWLTNNGWFEWAAKNKAGECTLTGFCGDCSFGDAIAVYARAPWLVPDLKQVFYEAAQVWVLDARSDAEHAYSDEAIDELIECNGYEFHEDGSLA